MDHIAGLAATGRKLLGPASDLVELEAENGLRHTSIVFHPEYREHTAITDALDVVRSFLESPLVTGLVELVGHAPEQGAFVYPTGTVWSVAEIIRALSDLGKPAGLRAGLELMYTAGQILVEGADAGSAAGVYSHGGLTPRRIMVKQDGQVMVIGYALPQVEILQYQQSGGRLPREDSFRYCPPERLEGRPEDISSDLFSLALIGFELMTGKPVYDGLVNDIRQKAARAEGSRRLFRFRDVVEEGVRDVLAQLLRPGPESRFADGDDFLDAVHGLLSRREVKGPSLIELMETVAGAGPRQGQTLEAGRTLMVDKDELAAELEQSAAGASAEGRAPERSWTPGRRRSVRRKSGDLDQLLRESRSVQPEPPAATVVEVEESLDMPAVTVDPVTATGPSHRWSKVSRSPGRRRSARTRSEPPPPAAPDRSAAPPPPVVPERTSVDLPPDPGSASNAADLLARIRGSDAPSRPPPAPVAAPVVPPPLSPPDDEATVMTSAEELRSAVATALDAGETVTLDTSQAQEDAPLAPTVSLSGPESAGQVSIEVMLPGAASPVSVSVPEAVSAAEAVGFLVGAHIAVPTDLSGRMAGWYRLTQADRRVAPDAVLARLRLGKPFGLEFLPLETCSAQVEVLQEGATVRFMSPVATTVPVASLVAHLCGWLGLGPGRWRLVLDGHVLSEHAVLADHTSADALTLVLRRDGE